MTAQCCVCGPASRPFARRLSKAAASILPGAALALLPKCPLCIAAWLTAATGVGFSAAGAAWVRGMLVVFWVAAVLKVIQPRGGYDVIKGTYNRFKNAPFPR